MSFTIHTPGGVHPTTGYSHAVTMGGLVFVAGQVARNYHVAAARQKEPYPPDPACFIPRMMTFLNACISKAPRGTMPVRR